MYIISKYKEYYDWVQSIYGIDKDIVLDRRNFFERTIIPNALDKYDFNREYKDILFIIEIGYTQYIVKVSYKLNVDKKRLNGYYFTPDYILDKIELVKTFESNMQIKDRQHPQNKAITPTNAYVLGVSLYKLQYITFDDIVHRASRINDNDEYVSLESVKGFVSANDAYDKIYNYLIDKKTPIVEDNRSDVEKLLSKGFDKKTSFRKM